MRLKLFSLPHLFGAVILVSSFLCSADDALLSAVKLDSPRDTMRSFVSAMDDYKTGVDLGDADKRQRIGDAIRCLNLSDVPFVLRQETGREAVIFLKEVIDRILVIDYDLIPDDVGDPSNPLLRWRLKDTEIVIARVDSGEHTGEYLFSKDTVYRAKEFYGKVRDREYQRPGGGAAYQEPWFEHAVPDWARGETLGVSNWQWLGLFVAIVIGLIIDKLVARLVRVLKAVAKRTTFRWDDELIRAIDKPTGLLCAGAFWFAAIYALRFEGIPQVVLFALVQIILSIAVIWMGYRLVDIASLYMEDLTAKTESTLDDHLVPLVCKALKIFVVVFGILVTFQGLGFNVMSVLAGLGLGGLAFALAAKDTCANLFGSIMIILDRPFNIGDWVIIGGTDGTVEEIGFRSTRIRTFYNSLITVPNSIVATSAIDNMGKREFRRIKAFFGLTYDTPPEKMEAFLEGIRNIVEANPHTRKDYYHVVFNEYGDFGLQVMLYCFLKVPDWATELVERQNIYLEILRLADRIGVDFAFPTQSLHVETFPGQDPIRQPHAIDPDQLRKAASGFGPAGADAKPGGLGIFLPPYEAVNSETSRQVGGDS